MVLETQSPQPPTATTRITAALRGYTGTSLLQLLPDPKAATQRQVQYTTLKACRLPASTAMEIKQPTPIPIRQLLRLQVYASQQPATGLHTVVPIRGMPIRARCLRIPIRTAS